MVCVGGVEGFDAPMMHEQSGTRMAQLRHGAMVTVMEQRRDWLKVCAGELGSMLIFLPRELHTAHTGA